MKILNIRKTRLALCLVFTLMLFIQCDTLVSLSHALDPATPGKPDLQIDIDVGSIHFRGEIAEFYILVSQAGNRVNAQVRANLYYNGSLLVNVTFLQQRVETGLFRIPYVIPIDASLGSYALVVDASYATTCFNFVGTGLKSFQVSPTFTSWDAWLIEIRNGIAVVKTDIGMIKIDLSNIDAALVSIDGKVATIQTDIGVIKTYVDDIEMRLTKIEGNVATINTTVGMIQGNLTSIQGDLINITTASGTIQFYVTSLNASITKIEGMSATIQTDVGEIKTSLASINSRLIALEGSIATIQTSLGTAKTSIESIGIKVTSIQGDVATLTTYLGDLNGTLVSIRGDMAEIQTDIGQILVKLNEKPSKTAETSLWLVLVAVIAVGAAGSGIYLCIRRRNKTA